MDRYPKKVEQLPTEEFHAILTPVSITIPGDERSRQAPGHGYPEHTVSHWEIEVFQSESAWKAAVLQRDGRETFKAVRITPAVIKRTTEIL